MQVAFAPEIDIGRTGYRQLQGVFFYLVRKRLFGLAIFVIVFAVYLASDTHGGRMALGSLHVLIFRGNPVEPVAPMQHVSDPSCSSWRTDSAHSR